MRHRGLLIRGGTLLCLAGLATCTPVTTETPGGFPALDATAQGRRYSAMMEALEKNLSGQPALWAENNRVRGSVIALKTLHTSVYGWRREYEERIATPAANYHLVGIACRVQNGEWSIVDIHSFVETTPHKST
jgi:surface antigen